MSKAEMTKGLLADWSIGRGKSVLPEYEYALRILQFGSRTGWPAVNVQAAHAYAGDRKKISYSFSPDSVFAPCNQAYDPEWIILALHGTG